MKKNSAKYSKRSKSFSSGKLSLLAPEEGFPALPVIKGVKFSAIHAGIKKQKQLDLMLVELTPGTTIAGSLTKSSTCSAPVKWCRKNLTCKNMPDLPLAIIANSGNANTFTGKSGFEAVNKTAIKVAQCIGSDKRNVFLYIILETLRDRLFKVREIFFIYS